MTIVITFPDRKTKPHRPCVFCGVTKSDISRHMMSAHRHEPAIIDIALLDKNERITALAQLRRDGISQSNATILAGGGSSSDLVCERKSEGEKVICSRCGGVFRKTFFYRHSKNRCQASAVSRPEPVAVPNVQGAEAARDPLWAKLLAEMDRNAIFEIVTADPTILRLGKNIFDERKPTKEKAARIKARSAMRRMARLLQLAKGVETAQVDIFQKVFHTNYQQMFSAAEYQLKETRQRDNRKPAALPNEEDLERLRTFLNEDVSTNGSLPMEQVTRPIYIPLRKVVLTRLTLLNARRGSEPARMLVTEFNERHEWVPRGSGCRYEITFLMGKGTGLVPVLIPVECTRAMDILVDRQCRARAGVSGNNHFVFAYTKHSSDGTTGYNEIMSVCRLIDIPVITATEVRHRSSTAFWAMVNIDETAIDRFMEHMGHSRSIDRNVYAVPPATQIIEHFKPYLTGEKGKKYPGKITMY